MPLGGIHCKTPLVDRSSRTDVAATACGKPQGLPQAVAATLTLFICNNNAACHGNHPNRKVMRRLNNDLRSIWARADAPVRDKLSLLKQTESSSQCAIRQLMRTVGIQRLNPPSYRFKCSFAFFQTPCRRQKSGPPFLWRGMNVK